MQTVATEFTFSPFRGNRLPHTSLYPLGVTECFSLNLSGHKQLQLSHYLVSAVSKCPWEHFCPLCQGRLLGYIIKTGKRTIFRKAARYTLGFFSPYKLETKIPIFKRALPAPNIPIKWKQCFQVPVNYHHFPLNHPTAICSSSAYTTVELADGEDWAVQDVTVPLPQSYSQK